MFTTSAPRWSDRFANSKAFGARNSHCGEAKDVSFTLDRRALSFYDPMVKDWVAEPGNFEVFAGASSRDLRLKGGFELFE